MRCTTRTAYRTKFYSDLSPPTRFDEEPQKNYHDHFVQALPQRFYQSVEKARIEYYSLFMTNGVISIVEKWFAMNFEEDIGDVIDRILVLLITNLSALYSE